MSPRLVYDIFAIAVFPLEVSKLSIVVRNLALFSNVASAISQFSRSLATASYNQDYSSAESWIPRKASRHHHHRYYGSRAVLKRRTPPALSLSEPEGVRE